VKKLSLKYVWALLGSVAIIAEVVECLRHFVFSDMNVWSGWGQWIGGIGALIAAYVALRISQKESVHRREQEHRRQFVDAHYLAVHGFSVKNWGTEPFVNIQIIQARDKDLQSRPLTNVYIPLLLPTGRWNFHELLAVELRQGNHDFEVQYEDLSGRVWQKFGDRLPREVTKQDHTWCKEPEMWRTTTAQYTLADGRD